MSFEERARIFKALSDPRRVEMLDLLAKHGALCGTELAEMMEISVALVSHHWEILAEAGLVDKRRVGQARYCTMEISRLGEAVGVWDEVAPCPDLTVSRRARAKRTRKTAG